MKIKIDNFGRITLQTDMRKELNINAGDELRISCNDNRITIVNAKVMKTREEILSFFKKINNLDDDISKGMKTALEWVLNDDIK